MFDLIVNAIQNAFDALGRLLAAPFQSLLDGVFALIPSLHLDLSFVPPQWWYLADLIFPVQFGINLVLAYITIFFAVLVIRWIMALIPTLN